MKAPVKVKVFALMAPVVLKPPAVTLLVTVRLFEILREPAKELEPVPVDVRVPLVVMLPPMDA